jgi:L-amino acid N-acyltransferase YncA
MVRQATRSRPLDREAAASDAEAIARIYNEGIEDRIATFEVRPRTAEDVRAWIGGDHPVLVVEEAGEILAWAAASAYSPRACYAGVAEVSVYVARAARGRGLGRLALDALAARAAAAGFHKLTGKILAENAASRALVRAAGFREVGVHERHARLDGAWRDVVVVERLLGG